VQLAIVLLAILGAYLGMLNLALLTVPGMDKALHFLLFGALAFFAVGWWADRRPWVVLAVLAALALLEEVAQALSANRTFSAVDLTATLLGVLVGGLLAARLLKRKR
jgi:hypothetical protein